jgi:hypothetical protein
VTRTGRRVALMLTAFISAALLALFLLNPALARDDAMPADIARLARWLKHHPADSRAASALSALALDADVPRRFDLWRGAFAHAQWLAPNRENATNAFVRGGLLHWYELGEGDRKLVLEKAAPMLRDFQTFTAMYRPLWELTHDFAYLRRNAPDHEKALTWLRTIAVTNGLFDEYRELRERTPPQQGSELTPSAIPGHWTVDCGRNEICRTAVARFTVARAGEPIIIDLQKVKSDDVPPYVEIYAEGVRVAEGAVMSQQRFRIAAPVAGLNRIEVRLVNGWTRNADQRRVRLS